MNSVPLSLQSILDTMEGSADGECLAIFDLDSTLYDLTLRVTAIIDRFANDSSVRARFPEACRKLANVEIRRTDWGITEPLERIGISKDENKELFREIHEAWARGFFSNDFLDRDFPLPGAVEFVRRCLAVGGRVLYLTGRDTPRMGDGTESSLRQCGFVVDVPRARLQLKPHAALDDAEFKADVIAELAHRYKHIWLFENEPVNINAVLKRVPSVKVVFVDTCHSGLERVENPHVTIQTFDGHFTIPISELE